MRLAVLGTGKIVQEALPVLEGLGIRPHAILGTERSRERTEALAARYRIPRRCFRYEEVLESGADTIYVALPNSLHYAYARRALEGDSTCWWRSPLSPPSPSSGSCGGWQPGGGWCWRRP